MHQILVGVLMRKEQLKDEELGGKLLAHAGFEWSSGQIVLHEGRGINVGGVIIGFDPDPDLNYVSKDLQGLTMNVECEMVSWFIHFSFVIVYPLFASDVATRYPVS